MKLDNQYFKVDGPRTVVFMYDDVSIDKVVVLEDGKPEKK